MLLGLLTSLFCHWYCLPPSPPSSPSSCPLLQCRDLIGKHSLLVSYNFLVEICQVFYQQLFFPLSGFPLVLGVLVDLPSQEAFSLKYHLAHPELKLVLKT